MANKLTFRVNLTPEIDFFGMFYPIYIIFIGIETMYNKYQPILQRSIFYVDRIAKCEIGGGPLSLLIIYVCGNNSSHTAVFLERERQLERFVGMNIFGSIFSQKIKIW